MKYFNLIFTFCFLISIVQSQYFLVDYFEHSPIYYNNSFDLLIYGSDLQNVNKITLNGNPCPFNLINNNTLACNASVADQYTLNFQYDLNLNVSSNFQNIFLYSLANISCSLNETCPSISVCSYGICASPPPTQPPVTPIPCLNNCGGPSNGICINGMCQCYIPWVGSDCLSKVINVTNPPVDNIEVYSFTNSPIYKNESFTLIIQGNNLLQSTNVSVAVNNLPCQIISFNNSRIECISPPVPANLNYYVVSISNQVKTVNFSVYYTVSCRNCIGECFSGVCYGSSSDSGTSSSEDNSIVCNFNRYNQTINITNYGQDNVEITCSGSGYVECFNNNFKCKSLDSYSAVQCSSLNQITCYAANSLTCNALDFTCTL